MHIHLYACSGKVLLWSENSDWILAGSNATPLDVFFTLVGHTSETTKISVLMDKGRYDI